MENFVQCKASDLMAVVLCLQGVVLPRVMEQIVQCKDHIAQQYLMQCIIQGFPDEFHVSTLDVLLGALPELQGSVKVHVILASMLDRLARQVHISHGGRGVSVCLRALSRRMSSWQACWTNLPGKCTNLGGGGGR